MEGTWTISELAERAAAALAADGSTQVSGRVRDVPNERLIRWYTTIGLVDPPLGRRGRTALYGPRHLLQLVAVKRRQAAGRSIAEIQVELTGATDATLERIAALPHPATAPPPQTSGGRGRVAPAPTSTPRPAAPHTPAPVTDPVPPPNTALAHHEGRTARNAPRRARPASPDHGETPAMAASTDDADQTVEPSPAAGHAADEHSTAQPAFWRARPDISYPKATVTDDYGANVPAETRPTVVQGIRLAPGLTLLLDVPALDGGDLAAIETAARPLLDELHRRGLLTATTTSPAFLPADPTGRSK